MAKVIIGIHGLSNKPEESQLHEWWLRAINDGLRRVGSPQISQTQFKLGYWADLRYEKPDPSPEPYNDPDNDKIDDDPSKIVDIGREFFGSIIGKFGDLKHQISTSERIEGIKQAVRGKVVVDLAEYYEDDSKIQFTDKAGTQTREALRAVLRALIEQHSADDLMVIGHSMGSIIAYDVLRGLRDTQLKVRQFVTIGSPLGIAQVKAKARGEWDGKDGPFVPEVITQSWINYGDRKDLVCADLTLAKEYKPHSGIDVQDVLVGNGYRSAENGKQKHNHHKSYGYLRTQAFGENLKEFLTS